MLDFRSGGRPTLRMVVIAATFVIAIAISLRRIAEPFGPALYLPDFTVFWTAARMAFATPELIYDIDAITRAQSWLVDAAVGPRPFAYPPSALLLFAPLALVPAWPALLTWNLVSLAAFVTVGRRYVRGWIGAIMLVSPSVVWCLMSGQTSLLLGAGILLALTWLPTRPLAAGVLLGMVAAVKPQILLLAPVALARGRHWQTAGAAAGAALLMVAASLPLGLELWRDWFGALGAFSAIVETGNLHPLGITPNSVAAVHGLELPWRLGAQLAGAALGAALVWHAFARDDLKLRAAALIGGSLLCSPYAMPYELAMLAPVAAATLAVGRRWCLLAGLTLIGLTGIVPVLALLAALFLDRRETERTE